MMLDRLFSRFRNRETVLDPHSAYEAWAVTYDQRENNALLAAEERAFQPLIDSIDLQSKDIVDFGCGTGRYISHCLGRGANSIVGIDFSRKMLEHTQEKSMLSGEVSLLEASVESLPLQSSSFDLGIATLILSHCADLSIPIAEMSRVLRPGGTLLISDWHPENDLRGWKRSFEVHTSNGRTDRYAALSHHHPIAEYLSHFRNNGLELQSLREPVIDEWLEPIFRRTKMMTVFQRYAGAPLVVVFLLRKK